MLICEFQISVKPPNFQIGPNRELQRAGIPSGKKTMQQIYNLLIYCLLSWSAINCVSPPIKSVEKKKVSVGHFYHLNDLMSTSACFVALWYNTNNFSLLCSWPYLINCKSTFAVNCDIFAKNNVLCKGVQHGRLFFK